MRSSPSALILLLLFASGCTVQSGVAPTEQVIDAPSGKDFGFVGKWRRLSNQKSPATHKPISISRINETQYSLSDLGREYETFAIVFTAIEVYPEKSHAIVDVQISDPAEGTTRRLVFASVQDDELKVWSIDARVLGELLYERRAPAVIEHNLYSSTVRCDSKLLLDTVKSHPKDLLGELQRFRRVSETSK